MKRPAEYSKSAAGVKGGRGSGDTADSEQQSAMTGRNSRRNATRHGRDNSAWSHKWVWTAVTALILIIGGANNTYPLPRGVAEAIAALLLGAAITSRNSSLPRMRGGDWLALALPAAVLVQFIPLPPSIWTVLPGRELIANLDRAVFGHLIWRPITLDIDATWRSLLFLIPPLAFYYAVRTGDELRIRAILAGAVCAFAIGAVLALFQIAGQGWAYPFDAARADNAFATGFFTNHNHQGTFALMAWVATGGWIALRREQPRYQGRWETLGMSGAVLGGSAVIAVLLVLTTASRAGLLLMAVGLPAAGCAWLAPQLAGPRHLLWSALGLAALSAAALLALPFMSDGTLGTIGERAALADDRRFEIWPQAVTVAQALMPTGSGFGTFRPAYEMFEPLDMVGMLYVNHAHNDYIELAIEGGVMALVLLAGFTAIWLRCTWRAWTDPQGNRAMLARLGSVMLLTAMLHSLVDYPARTVSISMLCGIAFALLVRGGEGQAARLASGNASL